MRRWTAVVVLGCVPLAGAIVDAQLPARVSAAAPAAMPARNAVQSENVYVGSAACQRCHEPEYESWRSTLHVQMTKPIAEARVLGDFSPGTTLQDSGRSYSMEKRDGRYFISVSKNARPAEKFEVAYTLGARRFQGYLSKLSDGRIYVLPVFWHNETQRWVDYKEITPIPNDPSHDLRQIWNVTCVNCHATNLVRNFDAATSTFATTWTEMGVGCEACHGPGRAHIDDPEHLNVFTMKKVPPRQIFDTCGYCHGNKNNVFLGFKAGDRYDDYAVPFLISQPIPPNDPQGDFWPDGRPSRFNRPQALTVTGCFQRGEATCTSCHRMHGSQNNHALKVAIDAPNDGHTLESDQLCTQCHGSLASAPRHTNHAPDSQGSRCINCHMSDVNWRLITRRLDHTFQPPVPELTARYGVPNACTTCHEDKSPEWAAATMDEWYGNRPAREAVVALSDTMYRAGSGDTSVIPQLAKLSVDRSRGALIRASAAEFAGQLIAMAGAPAAMPSEGLRRPSEASATARAGGGAPAPVEKSQAGRGASIDAATLNALIGASADAEPWVRIPALRAVATIRDPRVLPVLAAHLTDSSRVVRVSAAEALMNAGITVLDGAAGEALARAQEEWAESLRTFNDDSNDQTALGWLDAARGRGDPAVQALTAAIRLDPANARPHVYLGVLMARAGRYDEALQHFKSAKALAPNYANIDRLIEEAQKRR